MNLSKINKACAKIHNELKVKYAIVPTISQLRMACIYNSSKHNSNWNLEITSEFVSYNTSRNNLMNDMCNRIAKVK